MFSDGKTLALVGPTVLIEYLGPLFDGATVDVRFVAVVDDEVEIPVPIKGLLNGLELVPEGYCDPVSAR